MAEHAFATLDVFTDVPFTGNPLAVVEDADEIDDETMLAVAREFGFSETVFLQGPTEPGCDVRARIFTPGGELPFAGHPTIGTALWLARDGRSSVVLEELAGPVPVEVADGRATLTAPQPPRCRAVELGAAGLDAAEVAEVVGVAAGDVVGEPVLATAGTEFLFVELASLDALGDLDYGLADWRGRGGGRPELGMVSAHVAMPDGSRRIRMFGPGHGVPEDPATGGAAAAMAAVLARDLPDGTHTWTLHQGVEMGRPSRIDLAADVSGGSVTAARVGGTAVVVTTGSLRLGGRDRAPVR